MQIAGRIVRYGIFAMLALIVLIAVVGVTGFIIRVGGSWALAQWKGTTSTSAPVPSASGASTTTGTAANSAAGTVSKDLGLCQWNGGCDLRIPDVVPSSSIIYRQGDISADGSCSWDVLGPNELVPKPNATVRYIKITGLPEVMRTEAERRGQNACN